MSTSPRFGTFHIYSCSGRCLTFSEFQAKRFLNRILMRKYAAVMLPFCNSWTKINLFVNSVGKAKIFTTFWIWPNVLFSHTHLFAILEQKSIIHQCQGRGFLKRIPAFPSSYSVWEKLTNGHKQNTTSKRLLWPLQHWVFHLRTILVTSIKVTISSIFFFPKSKTRFVLIFFQGRYFCMTPATEGIIVGKTSSWLLVGLDGGKQYLRTS